MSPRRLVLILVFVLWAVNGALWAWVQFTPPPPPPPQKTTLMVYFEKKDPHKKVAKALEDAKIPFQLRPGQPWKHQVHEGFIVVNTIPSESTRKALFQGMKSLMPVKLVGDDIRLGVSYKTKAEASKAQKGAKVKGFEFEVKENIVEKTTKVVMIEIGPVEGDALTHAEDLLKKLNVKEEQIESKSDSSGPSSTASPSEPAK
jgi:hypothetical protein